MVKSSMSRKTIVSNAARDLVKTLEQRGFTCILTHEMAGFLQGSKVVPKDVKLVISPPLEGFLSIENVAKYLVDTDPAKFRARQRKDKSDVLSYYDTTVLSPKKMHCDFELIGVRNPPPPQYRSELTKRVDGLPVLSLFAIVMALLDDILSQYDSAINKNDFARRPPKKLYQKLRLLLPSSTLSFSPPGDKSFRLEALECFLRASSIFPEFASKLSPLIRACRHSKSLISLVHPNGTPVLDVTPRLQTLDFDVKDQDEQHHEVQSSPTGHSSSDAPNADSTQPQAVPSPDHTSWSPSPPEVKTAAQFRTEVITLVAKKVVDILHNLGIESALFGSLACYLYGNERPPNDIDIIAFPPVGRFMTAEWLKQAISNGDPENFCLEAAKNPHATYKVLYFLVGGELAPSCTFHKDKCKIDVLLPGTLHLPCLSNYNIKWKGGLPVVPFSVLLLQKLQGWDDHRRMPEPYKFEKHVTDASDVQSLLKLEHVVALRFSQPWTDRVLFSEEFINLTMSRVRDFAINYPASAGEWVRIGFNI
ncbi:hypothetical protein GALMADRAFT_1156181 [Galerina marginata CBS 339.88]|uniref:Uncharacterized protein n=1 Tax=Galerina marginata (strain CBS 339.88) TaxID=685588 RepID=A0A067S6T8_GALM3|nr:hypothetical protein GALMADRAFT_1156181 [Galerina marginata CBS 339.88]